jgi:hypothetical protein
MVRFVELVIGKINRGAARPRAKASPSEGSAFALGEWGDKWFAELCWFPHSPQ